MKKQTKIILALVTGLGAWMVVQAQQQPSPPKLPPSPPSLPKNLPPIPTFGVAKNDNGKFQIISAEYYSQETKPFLYKRLVKVDTTTGEAWVLHSARAPLRGEVRRWIPLLTK